MEKTKRSSESSFAGFLKSYSEGNMAFQTQIINQYAVDIQQLIEALYNLITNIQNLNIQTSDVYGVIQHLQNAVGALQTIQTPNATLDNIFLFVDEIEMAILNFNILKSSPTYPSLVTVKKSLDIVIYNLLTLARKIGGSSLIEKVISIAEKF